MARVKVTAGQLSNAVAILSVEDGKQAKRERVKPKATHPKTIEGALMQAKEMFETKEFIAIRRPVELVALYAYLHEKVFGVFPEEIRGTEATLASGLAGRCVKEHFGGSLEDAARFVCWTWWRQEQRAKKPGTTMFRITWRIQFGHSMVTDYKMAAAQRKKVS